MVFRGQPARTWAVLVAAVLATMALCAPSTLRSFHRIWMSLGEALGWVNSRILLTVTYYLVVVPIGLIRRFVGDDPLRRTFEPDANTYKVTRSVRSPSHMRHQY